MGFILPTKMIGAILLRETIQFMKRERKGKLLWYQLIENKELVRRWLNYFEMLLSLDEIKFRWCIKPPNVVPGTKPNLITNNDGNPSVYVTVAYTLFDVTDQGQDVSKLLRRKVMDTND